MTIEKREHDTLEPPVQAIAAGAARLETLAVFEGHNCVRIWGRAGILTQDIRTGLFDPNGAGPEANLWAAHPRDVAHLVLEAAIPALREALHDETVDELVEALVHTVEYVGLETLRPEQGWSWFDVLSKYTPRALQRLIDQSGVLDRLIAVERGETASAGDTVGDAHKPRIVRLPVDMPMDVAHYAISVCLRLGLLDDARGYLFMPHGVEFQPNPIEFQPTAAKQAADDPAPVDDTEPGSEPNTINDFLFGMGAHGLKATLPVAITTRQQAYRTAAWIKLMGETLPDDDPASTYDEVEQAVGNT